MNLLENYIVEVYSVKDITDKFIERYPGEEWATKPRVEVECLVNCYGSQKKETHIWLKEEYEKTIERGYYLG